MDQQLAANVVMFPSAVIDQESDLSRTGVRVMLEKAIDRLPPPFRAVFVLRPIEDLSVEEIGAELDSPPATVRTRMYRARALLRRELERGLHTCLADLFSVRWRAPAGR